MHRVLKVRACIITIIISEILCKLGRKLAEGDIASKSSNYVSAAFKAHRNLLAERGVEAINNVPSRLARNACGGTRIALLLTSFIEGAASELAYDTLLEVVPLHADEHEI